MTTTAYQVRSSLRLIAALTLMLSIAVPFAAQSAAYTNDTNWSGADWTLADGDIVAGVHTNVGHLSIPAGVTVTVESYDPDTNAFGRVTIFAASADIEGALMADSAGHPPGEGEGAGTDGTNHGGSGGGYGGRGGLGSQGQSREVYGSPFEPIDLGSGGGVAGTWGPAGAGAGALRLVVAGTLVVDGTLSSNGGAAESRSGGGSGGSIWLQADTIEGAGQITADGGTVADMNRGGGGGGGRIAIDATQNLFAGTIRAQGKTGFQAGYHGTYAFTSDPDKDLVIAHDIALPPGTNWLFRSLTVQSGIRFEIQSTLGTEALNYTNEVASRVRFLQDVTVPAGATLSADGWGYRTNDGPGGGTSHNNGCGGGAYGGRGGMGHNAVPGEVYGSAFAPDRIGSGGGGLGGTPGFGGNGAGALILEVDGTLTIEGTLSANGTQSNSRGGGGSGGSVWLTAATLAGGGTIAADGGEVNDTSRGGGGGGGRIALDTANHLFTGTIRAKGQPGARGRGRSGTFNFASDDTKDLVIAHDIALPPGTNWVFRSLTVTNEAIFNIQSTPGTDALNYTDEVASRVRVLDDLTVVSNAVLSADGLGYRGQQGPGRGIAGNNGGGGGSYGGLGGEGGAGSVSDTYGDPFESDRLGSGGGGYVGTPGWGGAGGGALILEAGGTLTVDGILSAHGENAVIARAGGGSGGSVWLKAPRISGNGMIGADGALGNLAGTTTGGGGGGGGRILLLYGAVEDFASRPEVVMDELNPVTMPERLSFSGTVTVDGGEGFTPGEDGSILYRFMPPPVGTLIFFR